MFSLGTCVGQLWNWDARVDMAKVIVLIAGRDPLEFFAGGDITYVRAHARAAIQAGFEPHIFCISSRSGVTETDYGLIHRTASPFRPFRYVMLPGHGPLMAACLERF